MHSSARTALLATTLILAGTLSAMAQETPAWEVAGGYSSIRWDDETFHGWLLSGAKHLTSTLAITGEVGGNYTTYELFDVSEGVHSFMVGPRLSVSGNAIATPFVQVLVGGARFHVEDAVLGYSDSSTGFALQPGAGVDVQMRPNVGLRLGVDYRRTSLNDESVGQFRFHVGVVLRGGTR